MGKTLDDFYNDLGTRESGGNYEIVNKWGYAGKYQMGEAAMIDAGYYKKPSGNYNNDWSGQFTGKDGVYSLDDYLKSKQAQENAQKAYKQAQWRYLQFLNADKYLGTEINGVKITQSGLLAAAHLKGQSSVSLYLNSNGKINPTDRLGTSVEEYLKKFAGYDVSEITGLKNDNMTQSEQFHTQTTQVIPTVPTANPTPAIITNPTETYTYDFNTPYMLQIEQNDYSQAFADIPFADPVNNKHIFTPEEIGNMTREEFEQNLSIIEQQLKNGLIKPQSEQPKDYSNYKNSETGSNKIYTREDISKMTTEEYSNNEKEIYAQMNSIGIPYKNDLPSNVKTYKKEKSYPTSSENADGKWVTINGNHVLIKD